MTHVLNSPRLLIKVHNLKKKMNRKHYVYYSKREDQLVPERYYYISKFGKEKNVFRPQMSPSKSEEKCLFYGRSTVYRSTKNIPEIKKR